MFYILNKSTDKPRWYTDHSSTCGVRGGYYFNRIIGGTNAEEGNIHAPHYFYDIPQVNLK